MCRECEPGEEVTPTHWVQIAVAYHYSIRTRKLVKAGASGLTMNIRMIMLVGVVENVEVVVISIFTEKDIGDECHD